MKIKKKILINQWEDFYTKEKDFITELKTQLEEIAFFSWKAKHRNKDGYTVAEQFSFLTGCAEDLLFAIKAYESKKIQANYILTPIQEVEKKLGV